MLTKTQQEDKTESPQDDVARSAPAIRHARVLFVGLLILLYAGTLMPGSAKAAIESHMWGVIPWSGLAHFSLFAAIAALPVYGRMRAAPWLALAIALFLAATTEGLQSFVPGRHPLLRDVGIDLSGTLLGLLTARFFKSKM